MNNYPLKEHSESSKRELERVKTLRRIEIAEKKVCLHLSVCHIQNQLNMFGQIRDEVAATLKQKLQTFHVSDHINII